MWVSLREGDRFYKLRRLGGSEHERFVFDLATDPTESLNLYDVDSDVQRSLFLRLEKYRSNLITAHARWRKARAAAPLAPGREEELLRSLGYIE